MQAGKVLSLTIDDGVIKLVGMKPGPLEAVFGLADRPWTSAVARKTTRALAACTGSPTRPPEATNTIVDGLSRLLASPLVDDSMIIRKADTSAGNVRFAVTYEYLAFNANTGEIVTLED